MLKLQVSIPSSTATMDFDFNSARPMPFLSAPSTPKRFGDFSLSAPSSPSRLGEFYRSFEDFEDSNGAEVPFTWEEKPGMPRSPKGGGDDFAFDFNSELEESSLSAEELFDGGKIKPLKPPPRLQYEDRSPLLSPRSPKSPRSPIAQGKKIIRDVFSPRKKKDSDPFAENTRNERGRERVQALTYNSSSRAARSLSPYRVSEYPWEEEEDQQNRKLQENTKQQETAAAKTASSNKSSSRKWRLTDFLLFRSASEGRASDQHYNKYPISLFRKPAEDTKNSSNFRSSTDTSNSGSTSGKRRKGTVSAHELHYKTNKAASEDLKKKTYLPYRQGILGRLAFSPAPHALVNGFGSPAR